MSSDDHIVLFRRAPRTLDRVALEEFARTLRDEVARGAVFECLITGDREIQKLNSQFRGKDAPTDVLSFPSVGATSVPRSGSGTEKRLAKIAKCCLAPDLWGRAVPCGGLSGRPSGAESPAQAKGLPHTRSSIANAANSSEARATYLGEIAISHHRAAAQAADFGHALEDEIRILMLHGLLHLLGMDHQTDRGAMRRAETRWRRRLGLPVGLIERVSA